ncbi:MAG: methylmalonyl-CoA mutase family protein, partial [Burkholderiales bacterium]
MTDLSIRSVPADPTAVRRLRFVTAASLFDGHDASINIVRRMLQAAGAEVIHLGHNRSVEEIVTAAIQEDAHAIAVSSYQGGHLEFFRYALELLRERGAGHVKVFGGGGGVIIPAEIEALHACGVARVYSPEDGARMGLQGMIDDMLAIAAEVCPGSIPGGLDALFCGEQGAVARAITLIESDALADDARTAVAQRAASNRAPVLGITGTGGAGKSSLTDELVRRFRVDYGDTLAIALIAIDPSRRRTGGALLGDRIRMNAIDSPRVFMRSLATRDSGAEVARCLPGAIEVCRAAGADLVIVETSGIGQGDAKIVSHADVSLYVMTPEYGAASQLEKIEMLDAADVVAINKFDRRGAEDALRDVRKQLQRNRQAFGARIEEMPVFGTVAARFNDPGVTTLYCAVRTALAEYGLVLGAGHSTPTSPLPPSAAAPILPSARSRYLAEIAESVRAYRRRAEDQAASAAELQHLTEARRMLAAAGGETGAIDALLAQMQPRLAHDANELLAGWPETVRLYAGEAAAVDGEGGATRLATLSLSGTRVPRIALPRYRDHGDLLRWLMLENVPGRFPFTGGVFALRREDEDPTRMFAGEGDCFRTNRRFHLLSRGMPAKRLSTAFDSVTLYGFDPDPRPDIYGKVGNSGVSIATLDDMKALYAGFDLCAPDTSVSMTINGPAPTLLAMFLNTAIDQQLARFRAEHGRAADEAEAAQFRARTLATVRGTVQADILKEDHGQNTCIFSPDFSLKAMGDVQEYFIAHGI